MHLRRISRKYFLYRFLVFLSCLLSLGECYAQDSSFAYQRHRITSNVFSGQRLRVEFPINVFITQSSDWDYNDVNEKQKPRIFFNGGACLALRNPTGYGMAVGAGLEYSTWGYLSYIGILHLDYFGAVFSAENKAGVFMFNRWNINYITGNTDKGEKFREYYLRFNLFHYTFKGFSFSYGFNRGLFRKNNTPYYANQGMIFNIGYIWP